MFFIKKIERRKLFYKNLKKEPEAKTMEHLKIID